uniref:Uncharacterized protein n=1 Tax=Picea glauca TaxID=3330 RepID=A0A117NIT1_PICGL|nr:hypothetical protein ABT39_MTgene266 [Picea glauca]
MSYRVDQKDVRLGGQARHTALTRDCSRDPISNHLYSLNRRFNRFPVERFEGGRDIYFICTNACSRLDTMNRTEICAETYIKYAFWVISDRSRT